MPTSNGPAEAVRGKVATSPSAWLPLLREALAKEGVLRCPLRGDSMRPTLPVECEIEIVPLPEVVPLGSPIVFVIGDQLVAHRLVHRVGDLWIAQGDGRRGPDQPLLRGQIMGLVAAGFWDGERRWPGRLASMLALFWVARYWLLRPARAIWRWLRSA